MYIKHCILQLHAKNVNVFLPKQKQMKADENDYCAFPPLVKNKYYLLKQCERDMYYIKGLLDVWQLIGIIPLNTVLVYLPVGDWLY